MAPTTAAEARREKAEAFIASLAHDTLGATVLPVGSYALKTYLPDSDVDVTLFLCAGQQEAWFLRIQEALSLCNSRPGSAL